MAENGNIELKPLPVKDFKGEELRCPTGQQMLCFN